MTNKPEQHEEPIQHEKQGTHEHLAYNDLPQNMKDTMQAINYLPKMMRHIIEAGEKVTDEYHVLLNATNDIVLTIAAQLIKNSYKSIIINDVNITLEEHLTLVFNLIAQRVEAYLEDDRNAAH